MKRIISLIISASLFLQMVIPMGSLVTYAAEEASEYKFEWEKQYKLTNGLEKTSYSDTGTEALVSWLVDSNMPYTLDYVVENTEVTDEENNKQAERIRFTFERTADKKAKATMAILKLDGQNKKEKDYKVFDFAKMEEDKVTQDQIEWDVDSDTPYPGGRVKVDDLEIKFRWNGSRVELHTNSVEHGYITPFRLKRGTTGPSETKDVLTGVEGFKISPIHIEIKDGKVVDKEEAIIMPSVEADEEPGHKPGVRVDFKRPKQMTLEFEEKPATDQDVSAILELKDATRSEKIKMEFNIDDGAEIKVGNKEDKKLSLNGDQYSVYLAKDDKEYEGKDSWENIIKWDKLDASRALEKAKLSISMKKAGNKVEGLGTYLAKPENEKGHTYLGYKIERSSLGKAYLEVQPYNGPSGTEYTYAVQLSPGGAVWGDPIISHTHITTGKDTEEPFTIPVPFSTGGGDQFYRIIVTSNQGGMSSQELQYQSDKDLSVPPPMPIIQSIDNIYVVPPKDLGDAPETIGFDLTWSAPKNTVQNKLLDQMLEKGSIYYELFFHEDLESTEGGGSLIKVFQVTLGEDNKVSVNTHGGTAGKIPAGVRYNSTKDTFTMENVVLKNPGKNAWEQIKLKVDGEDQYEKGSQYPEVEVTNDMPSQDVPGIYYVTMRALYEAKETTGAAINMGVSNESNPEPITISPLKEVIPVPTKIESKNLLDDLDNLDANAIKQMFSWGNVNTNRYVKQMLDPLKLSVGGEGKGIYELYLYQKKNIQESKLLSTSPAAINLAHGDSYKLTDENIEVLRRGEAIRLDFPGLSSTGMNNIILDGLDANQVYYTNIRLRLDIENINDEGEDLDPRYSVFSKEHSFTSYIKPDQPGPGERVPPVPEKFQLIDQPNNTTVKIGWAAPEYNKQDRESLHYQIVRVDARKLAKEEDNRLMTIKKLLGNDEKNELAAWRTKEVLVEKYEKSSSTWAKTMPEQESSKLQLEDSSLNPNQIYYYYVRTVLVEEGEEEVYSSWIGIPVTTDPIQKPIQLQIEDKETYPHDPKREIVVSFLAPIPQGANIPDDYNFDLAVQGELDDDYKLDYSKTRLTSARDDQDLPTGYSHYVYKINKLKPGKRYDIKVRIVDKLMDMVNGEYPKSLYSDRVTTRTHFDQDEQDKDDRFEEYLKYFEDKVEALRRKPYWTLEDSANEFSIKYRSSYIIPEINSQNTVKLDLREEVSDFTYYMPASVISSTNLSKTSFEIKQGNISYSVRPSTITSELEELKVAIEDIKAKDIRDYYIVFNFRQLPARISSGKDQALSPEIIVDTELVRLKEEDFLIDDDIMVRLNNEINREKERYIDDLERALERGKLLDDQLQVIINRSIKAIEKEHQKDVKDIIRRQTRKTVAIEKWGKSMLVIATLEGNAVAQGYRLAWEDTPLVTFNIGLGYGIEINQSGVYVFKGQKISMPIIPGVGGANNLIAKYQLTDFFGYNGQINPSQTVTKSNVLGAMARVLGAPRGADYTQHLRQMNIKGINNIGMNSPIKKGEGIYLLMQVYEKTHNKPINAVHIKNRNIVNNIRSFNQLHQPYVLVGADSKIISVGTGIRPNDLMQTKDVLEILTNIMATVR